MLTLQIQFRNSYGKLKSEDLKPSNAKQTVPSNPEYITEEVPESSAQRRDEEDRDAKNVTYSEPANFHSQEEGSYQQSGYYSASEILVKEGPEKLEEDEQQQQQQFQSQTDEGFYKAQKFPETRPQNSRRDLTNNRDLPYSYNQQPASDLNDLNKLKDYPKHPNNMVRLSASKIASTQRSSDKSRQQGNSHTFSKGYTKPAPKKGSQLNDEQNLSTSSEKQSQSRLKSSTSMPNNIRSLNTSGLTSESALDSEFSYFARGGVIPRSRRKLHDDPLDVPGPGHYHPEDHTRRGSPTTFSKSERIMYDKSRLDIPGPSHYYPVKHFTSNFS